MTDKPKLRGYTFIIHDDDSFTQKEIYNTLKEAYASLQTYCVGKDFHYFNKKELQALLEEYEGKEFEEYDVGFIFASRYDQFAATLRCIYECSKSTESDPVNPKEE